MNNPYGLQCEEMIRDLFLEIGIPHKFSRNGGREWYWWASPFEDRVLGVDCWVTLAECGEVAVDFTVMSDRNGEKFEDKIACASSRGVVLVALAQGMLVRATEGSQQALDEFEQELRCQIALKLKHLSGPRMTRQLADQRKRERRGSKAPAR